MLPETIVNLIKRKDQHVHEIDLSHFGLKDDDMFSLVELLENNPYITTLKLQRNNITAEGAKTLSTLRLELLDIRDNKVGNEGGKFLLLSKTIKNKKLSGNGISPEIFKLYEDPEIVHASTTAPIQLTSEEREAFSSFSKIASDHSKTNYVHTPTAKNSTGMPNSRELLQYVQEHSAHCVEELKHLDPNKLQNVEHLSSDIIKHFHIDALDSNSRAMLLISLINSMLTMNKENSPNPRAP